MATVRANPLAPVMFGAAAIFAQDNAVHAVRLDDGRRLWDWTGGDLVYGLWVTRGTVAVLTDQVSDHAQMTGLDAATGAVRWHVRVPGRGVFGNPIQTTDGGLAWLRADGHLQVVDLADGTIRWSHPEVVQSSPVSVAGLVVSAGNGVLTAFDDITGARRWSLDGLPANATLAVASGVILVTSAIEGPSFPTSLTAVDPTTGRIPWRFDPRVKPRFGSPAPVQVLSSGPAGVLVSINNPDVVYLLDSRTGQQSWSTNGSVDYGTVPAVLTTAEVGVEGGVGDRPYGCWSGPLVTARSAGASRCGDCLPPKAIRHRSSPDDSSCLLSVCFTQTRTCLSRSALQAAPRCGGCTCPPLPSRRCQCRTASLCRPPISGPRAPRVSRGLGRHRMIELQESPPGRFPSWVRSEAAIRAHRQLRVGRTERPAELGSAAVRPVHCCPPTPGARDRVSWETSAQQHAGVRMSFAAGRAKHGRRETAIIDRCPSDSFRAARG